MFPIINFTTNQLTMKKSLFYATFFVLFTFQCKQTDVTPEPSGTIETAATGRGEYKFIVNGKNIDSYEWSPGDNTRKYFEASPTIQYQNNGTYVVSLTLTGKGGTTKISKILVVNDVVGAVTFWTKNATYSIDVSAGGRNMGTITSNYSGTPDCGASGTAWSGYSFVPGTYSFSAKENRNNGSSWSGNITIYANQCTKLQLSQ
jgi:PKD repeat protein